MQRVCRVGPARQHAHLLHVTTDELMTLCDALWTVSLRPSVFLLAAKKKI